MSYPMRRMSYVNHCSITFLVSYGKDQHDSFFPQPTGSLDPSRSSIRANLLVVQRSYNWNWFWTQKAIAHWLNHLLQKNYFYISIYCHVFWFIHSAHECIFLHLKKVICFI